MKTRAFRKCDTVDFFPVQTPLTPQTQQENILQKLTELLDIYKGQKDAEALLTLLRQNYEEVTTDWSGTLYGGITIKWD